MAVPFDYTAEYRRKLCTPDEAAKVVKSGDWIDIAMGAGFPSLMDAAVARRKEELRDVKIRGYLIFDPIQMVECYPPALRLQQLAHVRLRAQALRQGSVQFQPHGVP